MRTNRRKIKHYIKNIIYKINIISIIKSKKYKKIACSKFDYSNKNITILSPNCIAGEIYNILNLKFLSPTINTSMNRRDFLLMCENLEEYLKVNAKFKRYKKKGTPVISICPKNLPEIEIAFPHDYDANLCVYNWNKRKERVNKDKIYIICDDQNLFFEDIERYNRIKCKNKILFTSEIKHVNEYVCYIGSKKLVKRYQYKGIDGLYKFQHFFNFTDFLNKK